MSACWNYVFFRALWIYSHPKSCQNVRDLRACHGQVNKNGGSLSLYRQCIQRKEVIIVWLPSLSWILSPSQKKFGSLSRNSAPPSEGAVTYLYVASKCLADKCIWRAWHKIKREKHCLGMLIRCNSVVQSINHSVSSDLLILWKVIATSLHVNCGLRLLEELCVANHQYKFHVWKWDSMFTMLADVAICYHSFDSRRRLQWGLLAAWSKHRDKISNCTVQEPNGLQCWIKNLLVSMPCLAMMPCQADQAVIGLSLSSPKH